jgi:hypothetical protein
MHIKPGVWFEQFAQMSCPCVALESTGRAVGVRCDDGGLPSAFEFSFLSAVLLSLLFLDGLFYFLILDHDNK